MGKIDDIQMELYNKCGRSFTYGAKSVTAVINETYVVCTYNDDPHLYNGLCREYYVVKMPKTEDEKIDQLRTVLQTLVDKHIANRGTKDEFTVTFTYPPNYVPDYWRDAIQALDETK